MSPRLGGNAQRQCHLDASRSRGPGTRLARIPWLWSLRLTGRGSIAASGIPEGSFRHRSRRPRGCGRVNGVKSEAAGAVITLGGESRHGGRSEPALGKNAVKFA